MNEVIDLKSFIDCASQDINRSISLKTKENDNTSKFIYKIAKNNSLIEKLLDELKVKYRRED